ncbi:MAG TPA: hypothetical protein PK819_10320 [Thermomicrobiales bacterium]|nr:hypothetical protein [Thermomicrobiales bacterium]
MAMHRAKDNGPTRTSFGALRWSSAPKKAASVSLFGFKAVGEAIAVCSPARIRRRNQYRTDLLAEEASAIDLPTTALVRIDELAERNARAWPRRLLVSCIQAIRHRIRKTHGLSSESPTVAMSEQERRDHFRSAAGEIGTILAEEGFSVPVCAFGHTHMVDCVRLADLTAVNAGSWLVEVSVAESEAAKQRLLPFVQIDPGSSTEPLRVACLAWDSGRHAIVQIRVTDTI